MTITSRLEAQHSLLLALREDTSDLRSGMRELRTDVNELRTDVNELRTDVNELRTDVNEFRTDTNRRLTALEDAMGKVLWGITEIKNRLPKEDPP